MSVTIPTNVPNECIHAVISGDCTIPNASTATLQRIFLHSRKDGCVLLVRSFDCHEYRYCHCPATTLFYRFQLREVSTWAWSLNFAALSHDVIVLVEVDSTALELCRIVEVPDSRMSARRSTSRSFARTGMTPLCPRQFRSQQCSFRDRCAHGLQSLHRRI
jgi:hypothetical protein